MGIFSVLIRAFWLLSSDFVDGKGGSFEQNNGGGKFCHDQQQHHQLEERAEFLPISRRLRKQEDFGDFGIFGKGHPMGVGGDH